MYNLSLTIKKDPNLTLLLLVRRHVSDIINYRKFYELRLSCLPILKNLNHDTYVFPGILV